jgi:hypothetical protein
MRERDERERHDWVAKEACFDEGVDEDTPVFSKHCLYAASERLHNVVLHLLNRPLIAP